MALTEDQKRIIEDIEIFLNRVQMHQIDIEARLYVNRPSGDRLMLPVNVGQVTQIFGVASAALTLPEITAKVNAEGNSGLDGPDSFSIMPAPVPTIDRQAYDTLLYVAQKQAEVIANLTTLLTAPGVTVNATAPNIQRDPDDGVDSHNGGAAPESAAAGNEDESGEDRRVPRYEPFIPE